MSPPAAPEVVRDRLRQLVRELEGEHRPRPAHDQGTRRAVLDLALLRAYCATMGVDDARLRSWFLQLVYAADARGVVRPSTRGRLKALLGLSERSHPGPLRQRLGALAELGVIVVKPSIEAPAAVEFPHWDELTAAHVDTVCSACFDSGGRPHPWPCPVELTLRRVFPGTSR